jgi:hypothetical protein
MSAPPRSEGESAAAGKRLTRFKKILLSLMVIGALGSITGVRVWASISSESQNPGATITSGTLTANLTLTGGTGTCYSYKNTGTFTMTLSSAAVATNTSITVASVPAAIALGTALRVWDKSGAAGGHFDDVTVSANVSASGSPTVINLTGGLAHGYAAGTGVFTDNFNEQGCDAAYAATTLMYPGVLQKATFTLTNDGSIKSVTGPNLTFFMPSCTKVATPGVPGYANLGGDPCALNGAIFYVQETQSDFTTTDSTHHCWYPSTANTCPITGSLFDFWSNQGYNDAVFGLPMGTGPNQGATRYFVVGTELPAAASNTLQGESATFRLGWYLQQNP